MPRGRVVASQKHKLCGASTCSRCGVPLSPNLFPFPGALAPTLGALFFINAVAKSRLTNGSAAVLLQNPVAIYFGRISYSLYLWHWGVFVLLRWTLGLETAWQMLLALLISVLFAAGSCHFIETPFRCMPAVRRQSPTVKITGSLVTIAFSFYLVSSLFSTQSSLTRSKLATPMLVSLRTKF